MFYNIGRLIRPSSATELVNEIWLLSIEISDEFSNFPGQFTIKA